MFVFLIAIVVAWVRSEDVSDVWRQAKNRIQVIRTAWHNELLKSVLPQHDVGRLITPTPTGATRSHSTINFILASLFPSMRHRPG